MHGKQDKRKKYIGWKAGSRARMDPYVVERLSINVLLSMNLLT